MKNDQENHRLQKWLSEAAENESAPVRDELWAAIEPHLPHKPAKRRRWLGWFWLGALGMGLAGLIWCIATHWGARQESAISTNWPASIPLNAGDNNDYCPESLPNPALPATPSHALAPPTPPLANSRPVNPQEEAAAPFTPSPPPPGRKAPIDAAAPFIPTPAAQPPVAGATPYQDPPSPTAPSASPPSAQRLQDAMGATTTSPTPDAAFIATLSPPLVVVGQLPNVVSLLDIPPAQPHWRAQPLLLARQHTPNRRTLSWGLASWSTSLRIRPYTQDEIAIVPLLAAEESSQNNRSTTYAAFFGLQHRLRGPWGWRAQLTWYHETHRAGFKTRQLANTPPTVQLLPGNQLRIDVAYADTIVNAQRQYAALGLESGLQWFPWPTRAHHLYLGAEIRRQGAAAGQRWSPAIKGQVDYALHPHWHIALSTAWQPRPMDWTYFSYTTLQVGITLRHSW